MSSIKKQVSSLSLLALLVTASIPSAQAVSYVPSMESVKKHTTQAAYTALFFASLRFWTREPDKTPSRFTFDNFVNELDSFQDTAYNVGVFVDDEIIGHVRRGGTPFANLENGGKFETGPGVAPKGLMGYLHSYWKPLVAAFGSVVLVQVIVKAASDSKSDDDFAEKFFKALSEKASTFGLVGIAATVAGVPATSIELSKK